MRKHCYYYCAPVTCQLLYWAFYPLAHSCEENLVPSMKLLQSGKFSSKILFSPSSFTTVMVTLCVSLNGTQVLGSDIWSSIILGVSVRLLLGEINVE